MYKAEVKGKGGIVVRVVAKSCNAENPESVITTFELEYHRYIHAELMTHRLFSRNAMSSRAVPVAKMIEQVRKNPATPIHWGANQAGMQAEKELSGDCLSEVKGEWAASAFNAADSAEFMSDHGAHKQIVNRILEPYQMMKTVVTATELDNFFWLRCHADAQPEIKELADCMYKAYQEADAEHLKEGEWHTPYVQGASCQDTGKRYYFIGDPFSSDEITLEDALKVSASCCAQVSYRLLDNSLDKAIKIYDRLVESKPIHASPFEHQAKPIISFDNSSGMTQLWPEGVTHMDLNYDYWSGNFKGWIQHRQLIPDNACWEYQK